MGTWTYDESAGELLVLTEVEGPAARLGHALTLRWTRWQASVEHDDGRPTRVRVTVPLDGLEVVHGEGGLKGLSSVEKAMVRRRALKELGRQEHPVIEFLGDEVARDEDGDGWVLSGTLRIRGRSRAYAVHVRSSGGVLSVLEPLRQTDFGVTPVRFLGGAFSVADEVRVRLGGVVAPADGYDGPMTMTPPDAQGPDDLGENLSEAERELLPDGDQAPSAGDIPSAEVDADNVPHPPGEDIG